MKRTLTVTDLTRMGGAYVCVAGQAEDGEWVRLHSPRATEFDLTAGQAPVIYPAARIECDLLRHAPAPPHTEDYTYDPKSIRPTGRLAADEWQALLERSAFPSVAAVFEAPIHNDLGRYLLGGAGPRSLGTVRPRGIAGVSYARGAEGNWDYRLRFHDRAGEDYNLKITDYTWQRHCQAQRGPNQDPSAIAAALTRTLKQRTVYLRIGLARKWKKFPERCYLQLNGVYTFPDYAEGRPFNEC